MITLSIISPDLCGWLHSWNRSTIIYYIFFLCCVFISDIYAIWLFHERPGEQNPSRFHGGGGRNKKAAQIQFSKFLEFVIQDI